MYIFQLSYGSSSPILSDRKRFPNFFRLAGPDQKLNPAKVALLKEFDWKKVATINQALEFFSVVIILSHFYDPNIGEMMWHNPHSISHALWHHEPRIQGQSLIYIWTVVSSFFLSLVE